MLMHGFVLALSTKEAKFYVVKLEYVHPALNVNCWIFPLSILIYWRIYYSCYISNILDYFFRIGDGIHKAEPGL